MSAIRRVNHSAVYSNRKKASSYSSVGRTLTFWAVALSCLAGVIAPAFFVSSFFLGETQEHSSIVMAASALPLPKPTRYPAEVLNAFRKLTEQRTFRASVITLYNARPSAQSKFEYVAPDRFHAVFDSIEFIIIGRSMYVHYNGNWVKTNPEKPLNLCFVDPKALESNYRTASNPRYVNDDTLDVGPMSIFEYRLGCSETNEAVRVWIGNTSLDGLPHRLESTGSNGVRTIVTYYDFNASITIAPPIP